jgi:plastocyanin
MLLIILKLMVTISFEGGNLPALEQINFSLGGYSMKRNPILNIIVILSFLFTAFGLALPTTAFASSPQTYTVLVGAENVARKSGVMAYFPATLHIHVGDTVVWNQNTHEIHTVTFLAGADTPVLLVPTPPGFVPEGLMINPLAAFPSAPLDGMYDGSTYANSGVMSTDPGQPTQFSLTFTQQGTFPYLCLVHGVMMSGAVVVEDPSVNIPSPAAVSMQAQLQIAQQLAHTNGLFGEAMSQVPPPQHNPDGTTNYTVLIGWSKGQFELMDFFPEKLIVHPGDTVTYMLSPTNVLFPHTVTFLNGAPDISFVIPIPNPPGPPILLLNPDVVNPINPGVPLTRTGIYSSGLLDPVGPFPKSYTLTIGDMSGNITYQCLLHDTSGMVAMLKVVP